MKNTNLLWLLVVIASTIAMVVATCNRKPELVIKRDIITKICCEDSVSIPVKVTLYQPDTAQCDSTPFETACGKYITGSSYYHWCAVSRDLMYNNVNFGDTIVVESVMPAAIFQIKLCIMDNMSSRYSGHIDIIVPPGIDDLKEGVDETLPFITEDAECRIVKIIRR